MAKSAYDCIHDNDFVSAKARYDNTTGRWLKYWFDTCFQIAQANPKYLAKYLFDEETSQITSVRVVVKYADAAPSHTYLVNLLNEQEKIVFTKVGKANEVGKRLTQILDKGYSEATVADVSIIKVYEMPSEDLAEAFDSLIKHYIKQNKVVGYYPKDRFTPCEFTAEDFAYFEKLYKTIIALH